MAKIREISSIEHGLAEAIKNLKAELIEKLLERVSRLLENVVIRI